jgi:hypothetical protein
MECLVRRFRLIGTCAPPLIGGRKNECCKRPNQAKVSNRTDFDMVKLAKSSSKVEAQLGNLLSVIPFLTSSRAHSFAYTYVVHLIQKVVQEWCTTLDEFKVGF